MACEHACGSRIGCARGDSLWNKAFVKGACSRPSCFCAAVINVASTRFKAGKCIEDALVHLRNKRGAGGINYRRVCPGDAALGMLYADDAGLSRNHPSS